MGKWYSYIRLFYFSHFIRAYPNHLGIASPVFYPKRPICAVPLMYRVYSFLILYICVLPTKIVTSSILPPPLSASCLFVSATLSNPYSIADLTASLYKQLDTCNLASGNGGQKCIRVSIATWLNYSHRSIIGIGMTMSSRCESKPF